MSIHDKPPTQNHPAPTLDLRIRRELLDIGGVDPESGKPILRIVWGQSMEASYFLGTRHLTYRHHVKKAAIWVPGGQGDTDIGIPRWFVEYAQPIVPSDWEHERKLQKQLGLPDIGPLPEGALTYEELGVIAEHDVFLETYRGDTLPRCCIIQRYGEGKQCLGMYRDPTMQDMAQVRAEWRSRMQGIKNLFRERASLLDIEQRRRDREVTEHDKTLRQEYWAGEIEQAASHVRKRVAASLRGDNLPDADKFTYHILPTKRFEEIKGHNAEPSKS